MASTRLNGAELAPWWKRVFCYMVDYAITYMIVVVIAVPLATVAVIVGAVGSAAGDGDSGSAASVVGGGLAILAIGALYVLVIAFGIYNYCILRGRTGRTLGARVMYLRVVSEATGTPVGGGTAFVRQLAHVLDVLPFGLGFLAPAFTPKKQTFADMVMHTVVVIDDRPVPPHITSFRGPRPAPQPQGPPPGWQPQPQFQPQQGPPPGWTPQPTQPQGPPPMQQPQPVRPAQPQSPQGPPPGWPAQPPA